MAVPAAAPTRRRRRHPPARRGPHPAASRRRRAGRRPRLAAAATGSSSCAPPAGAAEPAAPEALELAIERMRFALGVDDDLTEFVRDLSRRSADRRGDPPPAVAPPEAPAVAVGGARLGGHRAADRGQPRRRDPAPHRATLGGEAGAAASRSRAMPMPRGRPRPAARRALGATSSPASRPPSSRPSTSRRRARSR